MYIKAYSITFTSFGGSSKQDTANESRIKLFIEQFYYLSTMTISLSVIKNGLYISCIDNLQYI